MVDINDLEKDEFFYSDLVYYIKKKAGIKFEKNEEVENRIKERIKLKTISYNSNKPIFSVFEVEFLNFTRQVAGFAGDIDVYIDYSKISRYPELVEELLKKYDIEISQDSKFNQKVKKQMI